LIHHSDRGAQYTSDEFRTELAKHGIECSMSSTGNCYDNAVVESFFGILKRERVNRVRYRTRDEARRDLFNYIEVFYNRKRRHGYCGNISPVDFEAQLAGWTSHSLDDTSEPHNEAISKASGLTPPMWL
jgi:putative transposase